MQHKLSAGITRSRCVGGVDEHDFTASVCSFACEVCCERAPSGIENALGQVVILDHVANTEIFNRYMLVGGKQSMAQLVEEITALIGNPLMLPLQGNNRLALIGSAFLPPSDTALRHTQVFLGYPVPGRMLHMLPIAGRDERRKPHINADINASGRQGLWSDFAGQDGIPLARFARESERLDRAWHFAMPANSNAANTSDLESTAINFEAVTVLFEPETLEPMFPLKPGIAGEDPSLDTAKEGLKGFVEILHHGLQHMAMDRTSIGIAGFVYLDLTQLFVFAYSALVLLVSVFALGKTVVVPAATGLKRLIEAALLCCRGIEAIDNGFEHRATALSEQ